MDRTRRAGPEGAPAATPADLGRASSAAAQSGPSRSVPPGDSGASKDTVFVCVEPPPSPAPPRFPIRDWDRYECLSLLGRGGMGAVYKARDPRLQRYVALKLIRDNDPELVQRLIWEAQAQARVEHPNVCKVYEVGEAQGQPFIAMQYVDGQPLHHIARTMTLEQRVKVMADVADGLHAAHRLGLIHRDIKPANILVERTADGAFRPYLVDFGLAREIAADGRASTTEEGTPAYMAPEQVSGGLRQLDRRTDVYGLGSTLYEVLVGRPPFVDACVTSLIWRVANELPAPLRQLDKEIPVDLETVVMKCLEKAPQRRYDSAKRLALDLGRYLEGEPIEARPPSFGYLALKLAQKHKLAVAAAAAALVVLSFVGGVAVRERLAAARHAELSAQVASLAQGFGQDVKEMELFMRYAYALPLHEVSREKDVIRARMAELERKMQAMRGDAGDLVAGPGNYALGRGHLALHEPEEALARLEAALGSGYAAEEAKFAAGLAHGMLYRKRLDSARRRSGKLERSERQAELQERHKERHKERAIQYLRESARSVAERSAYTSALIALYEERFDEALDDARRAFARAPWDYEAKELEGDILFAKGAAARDRGERAEALAGFRSAIASYEVAAQMAESDPDLHEATAGAYGEILRIEAHLGEEIDRTFASLIESCDRAIRAEPRASGAHVKKARAYVLRAKRDLSRGSDPRADLDRAIAAGEQAIRWDPKEATAYGAIGASFFLIASYEGAEGRDTRPSLERAVENMQRSIALDPSSSWAWNDAGIAYGMMAEYSASHGADPLRLFELSVSHLERAIEIDPDEAPPRVNQGWFYAQRAQYELDHGLPPEESLELAKDSLEASIRLLPDNLPSYSNLGLAYLIEARYERLTGASPEVSLARALDCYGAATHLDPEDIEAQQGAGLALTEAAHAALDRGEDPTGAIEAARGVFEPIVAAKPRNAEAHLALGRLHLLSARWAASPGRTPAAPLDAAERSLLRALESIASNGGDARILGALAEVYRRRAGSAGQAPEGTRAEIAAGLAMIDRAIGIDPGLPAAIAEQGALLLLEARTERDPALRLDRARLAGARLERALEGNPLLARDYAPLRDEARALLEADGDRL
ncbi:protein kinase [Sorangium cellulosum]|uniref:Protein kinase n=1 Tax=Sorangium cellulosum TaxID=56 RepID=A0A2L0EIT1_SORCE|nr:serine/threonine-protein kinase [Sorangium cellulosum]AUX39198.1 protein kinase [Sorangium cellulosum]